MASQANLQAALVMLLLIPTKNLCGGNSMILDDAIRSESCNGYFNIFDPVFLLPLEYIYFFSRKNTDSLWMFFKDVFCSNSCLC